MCRTNTINSQFIISLYYGCFIFFSTHFTWIIAMNQVRLSERKRARKKMWCKRNSVKTGSWMVDGCEKEANRFRARIFFHDLSQFLHSFYINKLHPTRIEQQQQQKILTSNGVYTEGKINTVENIQRSGKISKIPRTKGIHFKNPWLFSVVKYSFRC